MCTLGDRSAVPTMKFGILAAKGLQTKPADLRDGVGEVGNDFGINSSQLEGSSPFIRCLSSFPNSG